MNLMKSQETFLFFEAFQFDVLQVAFEEIYTELKLRLGMCINRSVVVEA